MPNKIKIINISTDKKIFDPNSSVYKRMFEYSSLFNELHIIIRTDKREKYKKLNINNKLFIYPTNSYSKISFFWGLFWQGRKALKSSQIGDLTALITSQDPFENGLLGLILSKIYKVPLQVQIHTDFLNNYFAKDNLVNKIRVVMAKFVLPRADKVRVVSKRIEKSLIDEKIKLKNKISVLPIYTDIDAIFKKIGKIDLKEKYGFEKVVLMMSRLEKEKDIETGIRAFAMVTESVRGAGLMVVGSGNEEESLKNLAIELKIEGKVKFEDWTTDPISYFRASDIFLSTSLYEGFGLSILEAASSGCAIISTPVGIIGFEAPKEGVLIAEKGDTEIFAKHIKYLLENNKELEKYKMMARGIASTFAYNKEEYLEKYRESIVGN